MTRTAMKRRSADNHLSTQEWEQTFHLLITRSGLLCEGRTPACIPPGGRLEELPRERISIQHRRAQGSGGTSREDVHCLANLLVLCGTGTGAGCHPWVECHERAAAEARGLWVRHEYDANGNPVPIWTYPLVLFSGRRVLLDPVSPIYLPHPDPWGIAEMRAS